MSRKVAQNRPRLLIADDDRNLLEGLQEWLAGQGFDILPARTGAEAVRLAGDQQPALALIDLRLGSDDGMDVLQQIRQCSPGTSSLMMTGYGSPETAVEALRLGAFDLLTKPLLDQELLAALERARCQQQVLQENEHLRSQLDNRFGLGQIIGSDPRMRRTFEIIESIADSRVTVLITGESGTGKSMLARAIHRRSSRRNGPFVEVACGALPENLLESELFGHVAGAFTGATASRDGKFRLADGGTIFLDEIATASPALQVKLLRVLQELEFEQVGGTKTIKADVRVILATNEDLASAVAAGKFREDLYYRVNIINLQMPALRERSGDIPSLAQHFLQRICEESGRRFEGFDHDAMRLLQAWSWPGNVRELQNAIERAVLLGKGPRVAAIDLPPAIAAGVQAGSPAAPGQARQDIPAVGTGTFQGPGSLTRPGEPPARQQTLKEALEEPERQIILQSLRMNNWSRTATADQLGINRTTLYKKMRRLGIDNGRFAFAD